MKKKFCLLFLLIMTLFVLKSNAYAAKVENGQVKFGGQQKNISDFSDMIYKNPSDVKEVCFYAQENRTSQGYIDQLKSQGQKVDTNSNAKYLFIYNDNTASVGWNAGGCNINTKNDKCTDGIKTGEKEYNGLPNWGSEQGDALDALSAYKKNGECPAYMTLVENFGANIFYLSAKQDTPGYKAIQAAAEKKKKKMGGTVYKYFNIGESTGNFTESLTCTYENTHSEEKGATFDIQFTKDGDVNFLTEYINNSSWSVGLVNGDFKLQTNSRIHSSSYLKLIEKDKCPKTLSLCREHWWAAFWEMNYLILFGDGSISDSFCKPEDNWSFKCKGDNCSNKNICQVYTDYKAAMEKKINEYQDNKNNHRTIETRDSLNEYNDLKSQLNGYCKSVLSQQNYEEGSCVESCLDLAKDIAEWETKAGLRSSAGDKCNIGANLLSFVYNILKWAKYIAPVLVIILSILDFIKAIAAQNDDDMKKAQGKFVKRLIVSALLFLLPLIINFMLMTFGIYDSNCDITNLFS